MLDSRREFLATLILTAAGDHRETSTATRKTFTHWTHWLFSFIRGYWRGNRRERTPYPADRHASRTRGVCRHATDQHGN